MNRLRLRAMGLMLSAFVVCLLAGTTVGTSLRTGIGLSEFYAEIWHGSKPSQLAPLDTSGMSTTDALNFALLRSSLSALGTSADEQSAILAIARGGITAGTDQLQIAQDFRTAMGLVAKIQSKITTDIVPAEPSEGDESDEAENAREYIAAADSLVTSARKINREMARLEKYLSDGKTRIPTNFLVEGVRDFRNDISPSRNDAENWVLQHPDLADAIVDLELFLSDLETRLGRMDVDLGETALESVNTFLQATSASAGATDEKPRAPYMSRGIKP